MDVCADHAISREALVTLTVKAPDLIGARGPGVAVVGIGGAFVDVRTSISITFVTR